MLDTIIKVPTVTLPPLPGTTQTLTLPPGPGSTVTVKIPGSNETETVTIQPTQLPTHTVTETQTATQTATETVTATRQGPTNYVTVRPPPDDGNVIETILPDGPVGKAAVATLSIIILMALLILGMWIGYYLGFKESDRSNVRFLKALSDKIITRKH